MGFGSFVKKAVGIAAPIVGGAVGGPAGAAIGNLLGGAVAGTGSGGSLVNGYPVQAPNPAGFIGINYDGIKYPAGIQTVDYPNYPELNPYPDLPLYNNAPQLPVNFMGATTGEQGSLRSTGQAENILRELLDPDSKFIKDLAKEETQLLRNDRLRALSDITRADRRQRSTGRAGLFSGERGAENILRALTQSAQDTELAGRVSARGLAGDVAQQLGEVSGQYGNIANLESGRRDAYRSDLADLTTQQRSDYSTRLQQIQAQILGKYGQKRADTLGKYGADVDKLNAVLNKNPTRNFDAANAVYNSDKAAYESQQFDTLSGVASNIFGQLFGGGKTTSSQALPWQSKGNVNPAGGYY